MRRRDRARECIGERQVDSAIRQPIERRVLVEAVHLNRPFCRLARSVEREASVGFARDRHDAAIELRRERPVDFELGLAGGLAFRDVGKIQEGKLDRALDLVDAVAGKEDRGRVRVDPPNARAAMRRGSAQQREYLLLRFGLVHADVAGLTFVTWQPLCTMAMSRRRKLLFRERTAGARETHAFEEASTRRGSANGCSRNLNRPKSLRGFYFPLL